MVDRAHEGPWPCLSKHVVIKLARHGLAAEGVEDDVLGMASSCRLRSSEEPSADQSTLGAEHEHGGEATPVGDPSGSDYGDVPNHVDDHWHQGQRRHHSYVAPAFGALGDDYVSTIAGNQAGLLRSGHHVHDFAAGLVRLICEVRRAAPSQRQHRDALRESHLDCLRV
jgi:hypothetical protein